MRFVFPIWILSVCFFSGSVAQELRCDIQITSPQIQSSDKQVFDKLEQAIFEFMNNRRWTNDVFKNEERIECSIMLNITDWDLVAAYLATVTIQSSRPVYGTTYNTTIINLQDDNWSFLYTADQPLEFTITDNLSNLTSMLAYYAYLIIGMDYDTFSSEGGTPQFQKAQTIVENVQSSAASGWKPFENMRNRYWIIESLLTPDFKPLRSLSYKYHRLGLDKMKENVEEPRKIILKGLQDLKSVHIKQPGSYLMQLFFDAKSIEIVDLYSLALPKEKQDAFKILTKIDAAHALDYNKLKK
ncbi:DUF4835 family protein [bacterium AH-315-C07]|nr:DUF4835 family protein [bacterium AH-315-C07]